MEITVSCVVYPCDASILCSALSIKYMPDNLLNPCNTTDWKGDNMKKKQKKKIGKFGDIITFKTSDKRILNYQGYRRDIPCVLPYQ